MSTNLVPGSTVRVEMLGYLVDEDGKRAARHTQLLSLLLTIPIGRSFEVVDIDVYQNGSLLDTFQVCD